MDSKKMREYKYIRNTLPIANRTMTLDLSSTRPVFNIDSDEYVFILGMTWEDWVNSSFNTDGYKIDGSTVANSDRTLWVASNWSPVQATTKIIENYKYQTI